MATFKIVEYLRFDNHYADRVVDSKDLNPKFEIQNNLLYIYREKME